MAHGTYQADIQDTDHAQVQAVRRIEDDWVNALNSANIDAINRILGDDFVRPSRGARRFINKSELLSYYRDHLSSLRSSRLEIQNETVHIYGDTAIARGTIRRTDRAGHLLSTSLFTDVFVLRGGAWQAVSAEEEPIAATSSASK